ncbi:MAG: hypothetical protein Q8M20_18140 [Rhodocyclaceae bacterium]|nr:hypothetical protein [Rhodocyclaceae bacterium]
MTDPVDYEQQPGDVIKRNIGMLESDTKMIFFTIAHLSASLLRGVKPERYMPSLHAIHQLSQRAIDYHANIKRLQRQLDKNDG